VQFFTSALEAANHLTERHFVDAEFMYRPRPDGVREQIVFDYTLRSRLAALGKNDAVVFICDSEKTIASLKPFEIKFPHLTMTAIITNPLPTLGKPRHTPFDLEWDKPDQWQRMQTTDRWARIDTALHIGSLMNHSGYLLMPAHDAVWGQNLLPILEQFSLRYAKHGLPAAVSPYTYHQHSNVTGATIPTDIVYLLNTAFNRDTWFRWKIQRDAVQGFWGKMSMTPIGMCGTIRKQAEKTLWEDDLDIDRIIRDSGYGVRGLWMSNPNIYKQALPVFDRQGVRKVIERTLHYSLHIPSDKIGGSSLNMPLDWVGHLRAIIIPQFKHYNHEAEQLIAECAIEIEDRLKRYGASWLDWGAYRHVVRVRDPVVEVWMQK
jgi:hypothetical protein